MALIDQLQALPSQWAVMLQTRFAPVIDELKNTLTRAKDPINSALNLGVQLMREGKFDEAKVRFKIILWRQPTHAIALYNLAKCHLALNEKHEGINILNKSLAFNANNEDALFLKATYDGGKYAEAYSPHTTPLSALQEEFSYIAPGYSKTETIIGYLGHELIAKKLKELNIETESILDAGCGTGLCGELIKPHTKKLIGLDILPEMIAETQFIDPQPYDNIITADLRDHLLQVKEPTYDVICASNVMQLVGGLTPVFDGAANALKLDGYFIFTTYALNSQEDYKFIPNIKRFSHSSKYINSLADRTGLKVKEISETNLYKNDTRTAHIIVLQK